MLSERSNETSYKIEKVISEMNFLVLINCKLEQIDSFLAYSECLEVRARLFRRKELALDSATKKVLNDREKLRWNEIKTEIWPAQVAEVLDGSRLVVAVDLELGDRPVRVLRLVQQCNLNVAVEDRLCAVQRPVDAALLSSFLNTPGQHHDRSTALLEHHPPELTGKKFQF